MAAYKNKTIQTTISPAKFLAGVEPAARREDGEELLAWFSSVTGFEPKMWGPSIIGFGRYHYKYESGHEGDFMLTGFSPRKSALTIYVMPGFQSEKMQAKLGRLGKYKTGKSCLYINRLSDVDMDVLRDIVEDGVAYMRENYESWDQ
ncbi:MAG: DUF1801 domain-containing protein [Pseudomonadota bacterium]